MSEANRMSLPAGRQGGVVENKISNPKEEF
jgi:hypothetical protein